ncbi:MAG: hypothetical protein QG646_2926 [Euryarchaeota archaeon]|nr:hypothetical protein [Euryarchaeota archaeon]
MSDSIVASIPSFFIKPRIFELGYSILGRSSSQISVFMRIIKKGNIVFDVGANMGSFTILFSHLVGSQGKVHVFEPVPPTFEKLAKNIARAHKSDRVVLNRCAISDHSGTTSIRLPASDHTEASLKEHTMASWALKTVVSYDCELETLDRYVSLRNISKVDFVKIDVEGAEMLVLIGMQTILKGSTPPILMLEIFVPWIRDFGFTVDDIFSFLDNAGYQIYFIGANKLTICRDSTDIQKLPRFPDLVDFLCVPHNHNDKLLLLQELLQ